MGFDINKIGEPFRKVLDNLWTSISKSISVVVSSIFLIFALGSMFGFFIAKHPATPTWALMIPPLLGVIGYYYRTFAALLFIIFIIILFI